MFGDPAAEQDRAIALLDQLKAMRQLDEHQSQLARVLRYRRDWRLLERVLADTMEITRASDLLIAEVLHVLVAPEVHLEARVLAARALAHLLPRRPDQPRGLYDPGRVVQTMTDMARNHDGPPILQDALVDALASLGVDG
jgi:hypothetical protein